MPFSEETKKTALINAGYKCENCGKSLSVSTAEAHHIKAESAGGSDSLSNCKILCHECHVNTHSYGKH